MAKGSRIHGIAWIAMVLAFALHVIDEAVTDFLPLWNSFVIGLRESSSFVPFPTFEFRTWLGSLIAGIVVLGLLSPLVFRGNRSMHVLSYILAIVMALNAVGHIAASIYLGYPAPGVYSSPVVFAAAIALFVATRNATRGSEH